MKACFAHLCLLGSHFERFGSFDAVFGCGLEVGDGGGMSWGWTSMDAGDVVVGGEEDQRRRDSGRGDVLVRAGSEGASSCDCGRQARSWPTLNRIGPNQRRASPRLTIKPVAAASRPATS